MKRIVLFTTIMVLFSATAYAGIGDVIKGYFTIDKIVTGLLFLFSVVAAPLLLKGKTTLKEAGNFIDAISNAIEDNKVNKEEIKAIIAKKDDVINIWKPTPKEFK